MACRKTVRAGYPTAAGGYHARMRVVSLLPSATETLCAIGGEDLLVGRSHECDWPPSIADRPPLTSQKTTATTSRAIDEQVRDALGDVHAGRNGGEPAGDASAAEAPPSADRSLYHLDTEQLVALKPDVILTQDLCEVCSIDLNTVRGVAREMSPEPRVVSLNPARLEDVFDDLLTVGEAVGLDRNAQQAMVRLRGRYWAARDWVNPYIEGPEIAFLEWMDPLFVGGHWTPQLITDAGGRHSLNAPGAKSRQIDATELIESMPDRLIICPCGFDLETTRREIDVLRGQSWWSMLPAVMDGRVELVDGSQMFNRPGPRLVEAFEWLVSWINDLPQLMPADWPGETLGGA